ncbi:MAG: hypothetical protein AAF412_06165, partial [Pseudomonadota bacterium]
RSVFVEHAMKAAFDHFPISVGFGKCQLKYQSYESSGIIVNKYLNHAHNDFLELFLEGSLFAVILLVGYFVLVAHRCVVGQLVDMQKAALVGIIFVSIHSMVDYPLRTLSLGVVFAILNAVFFSSHSKNMKNPNELS